MSNSRLRLAQLPGGKEARRFLGHLRRPTKASAIRAAIDGVIVIYGLRKRGVRSLLAATDGVPATEDPSRSIEVSAAVDAGLGLIPAAPTCLRRSVTLVRELNRLRLAATIHIGVRNVEGKIEAHAWVQTGDVVVNDDPCVREAYAELTADELGGLIPLLR